GSTDVVIQLSVGRASAAFTQIPYGQNTSSVFLVSTSAVNSPHLHAGNHNITRNLGIICQGIVIRISEKMAYEKVAVVIIIFGKNLVFGQDSSSLHSNVFGFGALL